MTLFLALIFYFAPPGSGWGKAFKDLFKNDNPPQLPPKPKPMELKPVHAETPVEKRVEKTYERQTQDGEVQVIGVAAGFKFGFGFAFGVCVFMILFSTIGWMFVGAAVSSAANSMQHTLLMPSFQ